MRKYWDIISGIASGIILAIIAEFELERVQLYYSIIILMLVSIGALRLIKQEFDKRGQARQSRHNIIDNMVDTQKPIKALNISQHPLDEGVKIGSLIIKIFGGLKKMFEKIKIFFNKFKGYVLTAALALLTIIEMCSGSINAMFGGVLVINGIEVLPLVTLVLTAVVGIVSNGYTTEQREKIKALFTTSKPNELVIKEIKKTIKEKTAQLAEFNKVLTTQENALAAYESELETLNNTLAAKKEMYGMTPQLATDADVQLAANAVVECRNKIALKKEEIKKTKDTIEALTTTVNALKSQL